MPNKPESMTARLRGRASEGEKQYGQGPMSESARMSLPDVEAKFKEMRELIDETQQQYEAGNFTSLDAADVRGRMYSLQADVDQLTLVYRMNVEYSQEVEALRRKYNL